MIDPAFWIQYALLWLQYHLLEVGAFVFGASIIPLLSMYGPHPMISELVADINVTMGQLVYSLQYKGAKLFQTAEDTYEIRPMDEDDEPMAHATRLGGAPFGFDYARDPDAFDPDEVEVVDPGDLPSQANTVRFREQRREAETDGGQVQATPLDDKVLCGITRGGVRTFMDPDDVEDDEPTLFANMAEKLSEYRGAAGMGVANTALMRSMSEYGGDSGGFSGKLQAGVFILCLVFGFVAGVFLFL